MKSLEFSPVWFSCKSVRIGKENNSFWSSPFPPPFDIFHPVPITDVGFATWSVQQYNSSSKVIRNDMEYDPLVMFVHLFIYLVEDTHS